MDNINTLEELENYLHTKENISTPINERVYYVFLNKDMYKNIMKDIVRVYNRISNKYLIEDNEIKSPKIRFTKYFHPLIGWVEFYEVKNFEHKIKIINE